MPLNPGDSRFGQPIPADELLPSCQPNGTWNTSNILIFIVLFVFMIAGTHTLGNCSDLSWFWRIIGIVVTGAAGFIAWVGMSVEADWAREDYENRVAAQNGND